MKNKDRILSAPYTW